MSNEKTSNPEFAVGHEQIRQHWEWAKKQCPTNPKVGLRRQSKSSGTYIDLQFQLGAKRTARTSGEHFTISGINKAIDKAKLVSQYLVTCQSETDFLDWYNEAVLGKGQVQNDLMTFGEAIKLVEDYYWAGHDNKGNKRDRNPDNLMFPSWDRSYDETYGRALRLLPIDANISFDDMMKIIETKKEKSRPRQDCVYAYKKLAELSGHSKIWDKLNKLDTRVIKQKKDDKPLQSISLEDFLDLRKYVLEYGQNNKACRRYLDSRKAWLWVFSMQVVYGFRISEVFAIANIDKPYKAKDGVIIPALNDPKNTDMIVVMTGVTVLGTSTKTGYRLARPIIPPDKPNLLEELGIKEGELPKNRPTGKGKKSNEAVFFPHIARIQLTRWQKQIKSLLGDKDEFTQTHALRHLANLNGIMAGISLEQRAMSLGHSPAMNDSTYKKRRTTETTLAVLTTQTQSIPMDGAIAAYKSIYKTVDENAIELLAAIYGVTTSKVKKMLGFDD